MMSRICCSTQTSSILSTFISIFTYQEATEGTWVWIHRHHQHCHHRVFTLSDQDDYRTATCHFNGRTARNFKGFMLGGAHLVIVSFCMAHTDKIDL
jgi:hypothetical protein